MSGALSKTSRGGLAKTLRAEQWASQICAQLSKSAEAIIATGRLLVKAKADLPHGEWGRMFEEKLIPLSQGTAERFILIANHRLLSNSAHAPNLPSSWMTLYELTKVPDKALDNAFKDGLITPSMERREVKALLPVSRPEPVRSTPRRSPQDTQFHQALEEARAWMVKWGHLSALSPICDAIGTLLESHAGGSVNDGSDLDAK